MTLLLAAATVLAVSAQTDTTFEVAKGARLEIENFGGSIAVTAWNRNAVRIVAEHGRRTEIVVSQEGTACEIAARHSRGIPVAVDYRITAPAWMALKLAGTYTDIAVEGIRARIEAQTVRGDVQVEGGAEYVALGSVEGQVRLAGASGRIELSAVNDDVHAEKLEGDVVVESVNGNVRLAAVAANRVEASTVNGDIVFDGELRPDGHYDFATHNGDIALVVPETGDVSITVATYGGAFESAFPVSSAEQRRGRRFKFTIGEGRASANLESFQGKIHVVKPGAAILARLARDKEHEDPDPDSDHEHDEHDRNE